MHTCLMLVYKITANTVCKYIMCLYCEWCMHGNTSTMHGTCMEYASTMHGIYLYHA